MQLPWARWGGAPFQGPAPMAPDDQLMALAPPAALEKRESWRGLDTQQQFASRLLASPLASVRVMPAHATKGSYAFSLAICAARVVCPVSRHLSNPQQSRKISGPALTRRGPSVPAIERPAKRWSKPCPCLFWRLQRQHMDKIQPWNLRARIRLQHQEREDLSPNLGSNQRKLPSSSPTEPYDWAVSCLGCISGRGARAYRLHERRALSQTVASCCIRVGWLGPVKCWRFWLR